jgi:hypothetical protein
MFSLQWLLFPVIVERFKELLENIYSRDGTVLCIAKEWKDPTSLDVTVSSPALTLVPSEVMRQDRCCFQVT